MTSFGMQVTVPEGTFDNFNTNTLTPQKPIRKYFENKLIETESSSQLEYSPSPTTNADEELISTMDGVILGLEEDLVKVKLYPDTHARFPKVLFSDPKIIRIGQHIHYSIKRDIEGFRYQELTPNDNIPQNQNKNRVYELLNEIKLKND